MSLPNDDTQIFNFFLLESTFFGFDVEIVFGEDVKDFVDILLVSC